MKSGTLRNLMNIKENQSVQNEFGEVSPPTWVTVFPDVWCDILPVVGREFYAAQQEHAGVTHKIKMRYIPGVVGLKMCGVTDVDGLVYEFLAVLNVDNRYEELLIMARTGVANNA